MMLGARIGCSGGFSHSINDVYTMPPRGILPGYGASTPSFVNRSKVPSCSILWDHVTSHGPTRVFLMCLVTRPIQSTPASDDAEFVHDVFTQTCCVEGLASKLAARSNPISLGVTGGA